MHATTPPVRGRLPYVDAPPPRSRDKAIRPRHPPALMLRETRQRRRQMPLPGKRDGCSGSF